MYIMDCVNLSRKYYPSEYEDYEMIIWCNEVTAFLAELDEKNYYPVRMPHYKGSSEFGTDYLTTDFPVFMKGDAVNISINGGETEYNEVPVLDILYEDEKYKLYTVQGTFNETTVCDNVDITRCITDKTYCDPPYDEMYTYYILAKICLLQHDIDMYNQYMTMFNSLFDMYKKSRAGKKRHTRLINWWCKKK